MLEKNHKPDGKSGNSFRGLDTDEIATHMRIDDYNGLILPGGIRPGYLSGSMLQEGYCYREVQLPGDQREIPVLLAAISAPRLMDVFCDILRTAPFDESRADLVLESSHKIAGLGHEDHFSASKDTSVALDILLSVEESLINDGNAGFSFVFPELGMEIMIDEHKVLFVYGDSCIDRVLEVFDHHGIQHIKDLRLIVDDEHVHISSDQAADQFEKLRCFLSGGASLED